MKNFGEIGRYERKVGMRKEGMIKVGIREIGMRG